jgi:hypothetical protein
MKKSSERCIKIRFYLRARRKGAIKMRKKPPDASEGVSGTLRHVKVAAMWMHACVCVFQERERAAGLRVLALCVYWMGARRSRERERTALPGINIGAWDITLTHRAEHLALGTCMHAYLSGCARLVCVASATTTSRHAKLRQRNTKCVFGAEFWKKNSILFICKFVPLFSK